MTGAGKAGFGCGLVVLAALLPACAQRDRVLTPPLQRTEVRPQQSSPRQASIVPVRQTSPPQVEVVGRSVRGTPITLEIFGNGSDRMLIFGGIHGSEPESVTVAQELARYLRDNPILARGRTIGLIAVANPDGLEKRGRHNANDVDLNRNFPASNWRQAGAKVHPGSAPNSEPETGAVMAAVRRIQPNRIVSIHSIRRGRHCNNFDGPARGIADLMARYNRYPVTDSMGYPTPGSFGTWAGVDQRIPTITLELPREGDGLACWRENREALIAFIQYGNAAIAK